MSETDATLIIEALDLLFASYVFIACVSFIHKAVVHVLNF